MPLIFLQNIISASVFYRTLEIVDPALLDTTKIYTVAQINGSRTGAITLGNAPDNWHVSYAADGAIRLIFSRGTLMILK